MSRTLDILREDHRNFERILDLLESEIQIFQSAARPDYELLKAIVDYFYGYPDAAHHPVEDLILTRLRRRDPEAADAVGDLEWEHTKEKERLLQFAALIGDVLNEQEISRDVLISAATTFVTHLRRHIVLEEERFFSAAETHLTKEDWAVLDQNLVGEDDTLFRGDGKIEFATLRDEILNWSAEESGRHR